MEDQPEATDADDGRADDGTAVEATADAAPEPGSPATPAPTAVPSGPAAAETTGVASVDAALERLRDVDAAPLDEHVEIFDDVQRQLHDALAELDDE